MDKTESLYYNGQKKGNRKTISRKKLSDEIKSTYKTLVIVSILLSVATSTTYLIINANDSSQGYILESLQDENDKLQRESKRLDLEIAEVSSFTHLSEVDQLDEMDVMAEDLPETIQEEN